jgi:uncharacterized RDD family membrane protein YckC
MIMVSALNLIGSNGQLQSHWIRRFIGALVDGIIMFLIWTIIAVMIAIASIFIPGGVFIMPLFSGLLWLVYSGLMEGTSGATIGKRIVSLRVVSLEGPMNLYKGFVRNVSKIYGLIFLIDWLVGFLTDGDPRQRFLDRITKTTVVRTDVQEIIPGAFQPGGGPMPAPMPPQQPQPQYGAYQQPQYTAPQTQQPAQQPIQQAPSTQAQQPVEPVKEVPLESSTAAAGGGTYTRSELVAMRKDDLMKIAKQKNQKTSGTKRDLIDRILGEGDGT